MHLVQRGLCFVILLGSVSLTVASLASAKVCVLPQQRPSIEKERTVLDTLRHSRRFRLLRSDSLHNGLSFLANPSNEIWSFDSLHTGLSYLTNPDDGSLYLEGTANADSMLEAMTENPLKLKTSEFPWNAVESATTPWEKMPNSAPPESPGNFGQKFFLKKSTPKQRARPAPETSNGPRIWLLTERSVPG
jgi:hypothetical protein